ncbi:Holliday junction branch migration protein RuvA [Nakamurella antarctica]|uniref:Holliday junction branch migration complex subunit RuvA n=1 Tax=Nakamurella antarctica TaxID=1902245 RepID=A0A3G8ZLS3_9ACTN|nr:Holliday junction branch migration protein RuvA [Nakamurella antarctica]AZI57727.1 Holliday junction branch migration protein RuvA [Nakamurella antarctica]
MISSLRGTVQGISLDRVVIEVGGVGMSVRATPATLATLKRGTEAYLATTLVVREDSLTLYGFAADDARDLFELVQSVSGVGPKIAMALLAVFPPDELIQALGTGDVKRLTRAPGIGTKGAERLVLELRDKVGRLATAGGATSLSAGSGLGWTDKLTEALVGLGWSAKQASDAVESIAAETTDAAVVSGDVGVLLRRALALLGRSR